MSVVGKLSPRESRHDWIGVERDGAALKPGQRTPVSGQYPIVGPRGGKTGDEVTSIKGRPLPPTPQAGQGYGKPDKTK